MLIGKLARKFSRKAFTRAAQRFACQLDTTMVTVDRMTNYEGRVIDISIGGAMFRPRRAYLMDRRGAAVCLMIDEVEIFGRIAGSTPMGYGISFDEPVPLATVEMLVNRHAPVKPIEAPDLMTA